MKKFIAFLLFMTISLLVACSDSKTTEAPVDEKNVEEQTTPEESVQTETTNEVNTEATSSASSEEDLKEAFANYIDQISQLAAEEERILGLYSSVTGVNYQDDEILYYTLLDEVIPGYNLFIGDLEAIMPRHPEIVALHEKYIEAANIQLGAFTLMISALEEQNFDTITEANAALDESRTLLREWIYEVDALSAETGVSLN